MELNLIEIEVLHCLRKDHGMGGFSLGSSVLIDVFLEFFIPKHHTNYTLTFQSHSTREHNTDLVWHGRFNAIRMKTFFDSSTCMFYAITIKYRKFCLITQNNMVALFLCLVNMDISIILFYLCLMIKCFFLKF